MKPVLRFQNISKIYRLGTRGSLRQAIETSFKRFIHLSPYNDNNIFWALKNVSFEVNKGDVLGIIGPNGAGKTTILKILSRVTSPSSGSMEVNGRISSLIELGAGFHPDLTGRENIYLNGTILGLKRAEIKRLFNQIVEFAELEKFIDTPVKRYSSGMYARLGFSVAAHVNPDVLLVDEVLSVGDLSFRNKCIQRMKMLRDQGITIVFISHDMRSVYGMCTRGLLLHQGNVYYDGPIAETIQKYQEFLNQITLERISKIGEENRKSAQEAVLYGELLDSSGQPLTELEIGDSLQVRLNYVVNGQIEHPIFAVSIVRSDGLNCCAGTSLGHIEPILIENTGTLLLEFSSINLIPGTYTLMGLIWDRKMLNAYAFDAIGSFTITSKDRHIDENYGVFIPSIHWHSL